MTQEGSAEVNMDGLPDAIQAALEHHEAGRLAQAEAMYRDILRVQPQHPEALHLLGAMAHQLENHALALELIARAIAADSCVPIYHNNLGSTYRALGRLDEAVASFRKALALEHDYADAHYNLGVALSDRGEPDRPRRASAPRSRCNPITSARTTTSAWCTRPRAGRTRRWHAGAGWWRCSRSTASPGT